MDTLLVPPREVFRAAVIASADYTTVGVGIGHVQIRQDFYAQCR